MQTIRLTDQLDDEAADALAGTLLGPDSYDTLVRDDARVYTPEGELLLVYRRGVLPAAACAAAYPALRDAAGLTDNRGMASGLPPTQLAAAGAVRGNRHRGFLKRDGTVSRQDRTAAVASGVVGYFERTSRNPYCRMTAYSVAHSDRVAAALPLFRAVDAVFAAEVPDRHAAQRAYIERTSPDFYLHGTVFTTVTVNRNWQTAVHKDAGDLRAGFGVLTALRAGQFDGCFLCFPKYRVAVDIRTRDVLLCDVHQWHGNTPIVGAPGQFERISLVLCYREGIKNCGSAAQEAEFVRRRKPGTRLDVDLSPGAVAEAAGEADAQG